MADIFKFTGSTPSDHDLPSPQQMKALHALRETIINFVDPMLNWKSHHRNVVHTALQAVAHAAAKQVSKDDFVRMADEAYQNVLDEKRD